MHGDPGRTSSYMNELQPLPIHRPQLQIDFTHMLSISFRTILPLGY